MLTKKHKIGRIITSIFVFLQTSWLLYSGFGYFLYRKYSGPGFVYKHMQKETSILFLVFGGMLLLCFIFLLRNKQWAWYGAFTIALMNIFFLPIGSLLAVICMITLSKFRQSFRITHAFHEPDPRSFIIPRR